jgi:quinoprotein glucose dehydrogenase
MYALDALTGEPVVSFGDSGSISLHEGLGERAQDLWVIVTTPGVIFKDLYIIGGRVSEGFNAAPGYIRAFNVRSGELEWMFHTIPHPGEEGYDTWPPNAYQTVGGVNSWAGMALDEEREIVYVPTGSASFDSYGGNRLGKNLFANSLIALNANTGERIWHYQTIHHDIWDMDLPSPPNLVVIERNGEQIPAVAQVTKTGNTFVFHRETGEPLFPIKQIEIDSSDVPGEEAWPTQPIPELPPPFARQVFTDELITDISRESHEYILNELKKYRYGKMLIPPSLQGTVVFPGFDGGAEWGGAAVDPNEGILYVNSNEMVWTVQLTENKDYQTVFTESTSPGNAVYSVHCASCHGQDLSGDNHYGYR